MTPILEALTLPFRICEAATPFMLWLMVEGLIDEDVVLTLCAPIIWLAAEFDFISRRQDVWIDRVLALRTVVYLVVGRKPQ